MTYDVVMPQLGLTMEEGAVISWQKQLGNWVEKGEILFLVETDKVEMEVESTKSGYLSSILADVGQKVPVGTVIAVLGDQPGEGASRQPAISEDANRAKTSDTTSGEPKCSHHKISPPPSVKSSSRQISSSPRARRLAAELGVDINRVQSARGGRIAEEDVRQYYEANKAQLATSQMTRPHVTSDPISANRKVIAQKMTASFQRAPHFYLSVEANAEEIVKVRTRLLETFKQSAGLTLTYTDLLLRALAMSLKENPDVNSYWENGEIGCRSSVDVAFAVQTADGLIVPIIRNADQLDLLDLARQRSSLADKAKAGKLTLQELEGGSATLSNLGAFGVDWFQAILNPPQSVILAVGRISKKAIVIDDRVEVRPTVILTLSVDHRVLDGVAASNFLGRVKGLIEKPSDMLA